MALYMEMSLSLPTFFYKNVLYKNIETEHNRNKFMNILKEYTEAKLHSIKLNSEKFRKNSYCSDFISDL